MRKSLDTYTVLGPWLVTSDELADPSQLEMNFQSMVSRVSARIRVT